MGQPDACWTWVGTINYQGYGARMVKGRGYQAAHRLAYEHWVGPIPDGIEVDHRCHTDDSDCYAGDECLHRSCVNPEHLELVTGRENKQRAHRRIRTDCSEGHALIGDNLVIVNSAQGEIRRCRKCHNEYMKLRQRRVKGSKPQVLIGANCTVGHLMNEENTAIGRRENGTLRKICKTCRRDRKRAWTHAKALAKAGTTPEANTPETNSSTNSIGVTT